MPRGYDQEYLGDPRPLRDTHGNVVGGPAQDLPTAANLQNQAAPTPQDHMGRMIAAFDEMLHRLSIATLTIEGVADKLLGAEASTDQKDLSNAINPSSVLARFEQKIGEFERTIRRLQYSAHRLETL